MIYLLLIIQVQSELNIILLNYKSEREIKIKYSIQIPHSINKEVFFFKIQIVKLHEYRLGRIQ